MSRLLIVGDASEEHVGSHLLHAAAEMHLTAHFADSRGARGSALARRVCWYFLQRRPGRLRAFSGEIVKLCAERAPEVLLTTGFAPIAAAALKEIGAMGIYRVNYLTDDPWNPAQRASWFLRAVREYDEVLSTRRANLSELRELGCRRVGYLPFAFAPHLHFPQTLAPERERELETDIVFAGGADSDRVPYIAALIGAGFRIGLYGRYWERFPETRALTHDLQPPGVVREAIAASKVALCLVRRANRDGTCMRTFEVPAMNACMLVEKTAEHVELFGPDGQAVLYFESIPEMVERARWLIGHDSERNRIKEAGYRLILGGNHTYRDRLNTILQWASVRAA